jgi:signal peptidase II
VMKKTAYVLLIVLSVVALDQITKHLIINYLSFSDSVEVFPFLHIINIRNTGAAFGSFKGLGSGFFIVVSLVAILFVINLLRKRMYNFFGLSLVLGGAIGNLIDRIRYGKVVDFVDFNIGSFHWPAFNVADSALTVGIIIILVVSFLRK